VDQSVWRLGYGLDNRGSISGRGNDGIFLFTTPSRPALGPTQPPNQWVPRALTPRVKRLLREADHSPPSTAEVKNVWGYTPTPDAHPSWGRCLVQHRNNFIVFYLIKWNEQETLPSLVYWKILKHEAIVVNFVPPVTQFTHSQGKERCPTLKPTVHSAL
jgi:hypothetical protein